MDTIGGIHSGTYLRRDMHTEETYVRRKHTREGGIIPKNTHTGGTYIGTGTYMKETYIRRGHIRKKHARGETYTQRGHIHGGDLRTPTRREGIYIYVRNNHTKKYTRRRNIQTDGTYTRRRHAHEGTCTRRDIHREGHTPPLVPLFNTHQSC